ncbi:helix-turn-helix DNA binding domain protein [Gordonia phage Finkle]|uniref:Helix-turn-helix DNA binding domain protein n=1 Tax=Gordonia phage Finkle TaxID=2926099 RepID=A0A9E7SZH1_9CAUD|nr:helix-turn-helix DNA binding domain protein [Gordonia phage Finkle]UTN92963.1 helix-turn-helix DNA binding domain protein [Gordonia phage Finkle]
MFLLSLDEIERVKRVNGISTYVALEKRTPLSERTWRQAVKTRKPTPQVLDALASLGARADRILVADDAARIPA